MIIQVTTQTNIDTVARQALPASATDQTVAQLVSAIRAANPGVNLDTIQPGMPIIIPASPTAADDQSAFAQTMLNQLEFEAVEAIAELAPLAASGPGVFATVIQQWISGLNSLTAQI
jgi:hypothetical protein